MKQKVYIKGYKPAILSHKTRYKGKTYYHVSWTNYPLPKLYSLPKYHTKVIPEELVLRVETIYPRWIRYLQQKLTKLSRRLV